MADLATTVEAVPEGASLLDRKMNKTSSRLSGEISGDAACAFMGVRFGSWPKSARGGLYCQ